MLSAVIVMSGCFGSGTTDGQDDSEDDSDSGDGGTTVVNNYYNTTTIVEQPPLMLFSGSVNTTGDNPQTVGNITINPNQTLEIVASWATQNSSGNPNEASAVIQPDCFGTYGITLRSDNHQKADLPLFMPTDGNTCNYEVSIGHSAQNVNDVSWSILYRVHEIG